MSNWKRALLEAAGYAAFFIAVFALSLYATFDANALKPALMEAALRAHWKLEIEDISLHRLLGLDLRGILVSPAEPDPEKAAEPMRIDRLVFSTGLSSIPGALSALKQNRVPAADVAFSLWIGGGKVTGDYEPDKQAMELNTKVKDLPLEKISLPSFYYQGLKLGGKLNAKIVLDLKDQMNPETWNGKIEVDIDKPRVSDFQVAGITMAGLAMDKGTLIADIADGTMKLNPLKLQGEDVPLSLTGTIILRKPLGLSILDLSGPLKISEAYKQKNPLLSAYTPASDNFSYKGALSGLFPGIR